MSAVQTPVDSDISEYKYIHTYGSFSYVTSSKSVSYDFKALC